MSLMAVLRRRPTMDAEQAQDAAAAPRRWRISALWRNRKLAFCVVAAAAALVYAGSLWNGMAYDDVAIINNDARIRQFQVLRIFGESYWLNNPALAIYRPLTSLSFAADWVVSRGYPWFFHLVNVLEHAGASGLVLLLLLEFFAPAAAFLGALVFAVHPVHVEAVANVVGRAELLSALFYLGAILVWMHRGPGVAWRRTAVVTLLFALALLAKESSATLPAALVLADAAQRRWKLEWRSLRAYVPAVAPALATLALVLGAFLWLRFLVLGRFSPSIVDPIFDLSVKPAGRVLTALQAWPVYARLLFFPRTLLADYGPHILMPISAWTPSSLLGLVILLVLLVGGLAALRRGAGRTGLGLLWFVATILPVSNLLFPIGIVVAERTLYLPMAALCMGVAALGESVAGTRPVARRAFLLGVVATLSALAVRTVTRVPSWSSTNSVFYALNADRPDSFRAAWHLARIARTQKNTPLALARYERALRLWPYRRALVLEALAEETKAGRTRQARSLAAFAAQRWPRDVETQRLYAQAALAAGDSAAAVAAARAGLALAPKDTTLLRIVRLPPVAPRG